MRLHCRLYFFHVCLVLGVAFAFNGSLAAQVQVPFVGCKSDGQAGPQQPPTSAGLEIRLEASLAKRVALYKAILGDPVLGPRGWSCFEVYGSSGSSLFVTPKSIEWADIVSPKWEGITGDGIEATTTYWDGSGQILVAKVVARVFPAYRWLASGVIAEFKSVGDFPFGPFPADRLKYLNERVVEYETPARLQGLGTAGRLEFHPNNDPIHGVAIMNTQDSRLKHLAVRLPKNMNNLLRTIITQFEAGEL